MKFPGIFFIISVMLLASCGSRNGETLFQLIPSTKTQIEFNNQITENDTINPFDMTNMYNGAGVGIADFNNDGLNDIYFAGNQVAGQLYLNQGGLVFRDVTGTAEVDGEVSKGKVKRKLEEGMMIDKDGQMTDKDGKMLDNTGWE